MQREEVLSPGAAANFLVAVCSGAQTIYEAYSDVETPTRIFRTHDELHQYIAEFRANGKKYFTFAAHYEGTGGNIDIRRFDLLPEKCQGAKWRETTEGWGLVSIQLTYEGDKGVKCRVAANSQKRAVRWAATLERLGPTESWVWPLVEKHTRRLIRKLRSDT
jgi:hypothetical protein